MKAFAENNFGVISPIHFGPNEIDLDFKFLEYISEHNAPQLLINFQKKTNLDKIYKVKAVNAAAWLMSRKCIEEVGVFDPIFPHYGEDTDYIKRMRYHNYKIGVAPNLCMVHNRNQQASDSKDKVYYRLKIWALSYKKDINKSMFFIVTRFPFELFFRVRRHYNNPTNAIVIYIKIMVFVISKYVQIQRHRLKSKENRAFI